MKRLIAALAAMMLLVSGAGSALADGGASAVDLLRKISQQEQAGTGSPALVTELETTTAAVDVDPMNVENEVALEDGATEGEQYASYEKRLEAEVVQDPANLASLTKLGLAYQLDNQHERALAVLEKTVALEPGVQALYDALAASVSVVHPGLQVYVDGKPLVTDVAATRVEGRVLVPMRAIAEQLGAIPAYDPTTFTARIHLGADEIVVTKDSQTAYVNGKPVMLDVPAMIVNGRFLVPVRVVSEGLRKLVVYHAGVSGTAVIAIVDK